ncbi:FAD-dependent oxidoreductase [Sphingobacterium chuzhouense]|uniref:FAD-dependent oxidoreductase n=1 Tax=Sphingobacterium chuzhouense TaxID=1742264 RepID=A0ABR7XMG1_9SPHI|nr:FAD-dependent oxidoreductase [Sphingobacterium chuzhouense]MBD1420336.1 FAD-dependent oxidoreductase [Sphingobacterium chuzhouense]
MKRRDFINGLTCVGGAMMAPPLLGFSHLGDQSNQMIIEQYANESIIRADVVIIGGGLGGVAATLSLLKKGKKVILTEETDWIGGQLTQQGVPADEHQWIETHGAPKSYRDFRKRIRNYYRNNYPLTEEAKSNPLLNPGGGLVSRICHEPKVALAVLMDLLAPYQSNGQLILQLDCKAISADVSDTFVKKIIVQSSITGQRCMLEAPYFVDATELGDVLPLTGTEFVIGTESKEETHELHAPLTGDPDNQQAFTTCFALDYVPGEDFVQKPEDYHFWSAYIPAIQPSWSGRLLDLSYSNPRTLEPKKLGFNPTGKSTGSVLNLWNYRKIISRSNFQPDFYQGDITLVNWPQNDYMLGNLIGVSDLEFKKHLASSKQLGLSLLYWLQTEAPRPDGKKGWRGLRLRKDLMGTEDGFAKYPYVRESRRIKALFTILEEHVGKENRTLVANAGEDATQAAYFYDSVGVGYYHIDLHPTTKANYVDFASLPFQIPLGALLPIRMDNIFPANKNIGTTHITNGCYRLHPVEWSIGEAVGLLLAFSMEKKVLPKEIRRNKELLVAFQDVLHAEGVETAWKS